MGALPSMFCEVMLVIPSSAISAWWHLRAVAIPRRGSATTPANYVLVPCGFAA
jgi:hypothetical protein